MSPSKRSEAEGVIFYIKENPNATPESINQGIMDAISTVANESNLARKIGVVYPDGKIKILLIQDFKDLNGARF